MAVTAAWTAPTQELRLGTVSLVSSLPLEHTPGVRTVMRLIHQPHNNLTLSSILRSQLLPQTRKVLIGRPSTLANDFPVPAGIIMNINNAVRACLQASLHQQVVRAEILGVESPAEFVIDQVLPCDGKAEDVEFVFGGKVDHLAGPIAAVVFVTVAVLAEGAVDIC